MGSELSNLSSLLYNNKKSDDSSLFNISLRTNKIEILQGFYQPRPLLSLANELS